MKNLRYSVCVAAAAAFFNSCTTNLYVSNAVNAPLLKEKGEVKINATSNDLQVAAGVGKNFGIMANGYYQTYSASNNYEHRGGMGELGLGYFTASEDGHLVFEAFGGAGIGNVYKQKTFTDQNDNNYLASFKANAAKFFVQPDFGYSSKYFDAVFTPRFSFVKYTSFNPTSNYPAQALKDDYLDNGNLTDPLYVFAEPAITIRGGFKFIKLQAQYGLTVNLTGNNIRHPSNFSSIGIVIDIAKWYKD